jgi:predicted secreted protein
MPLKHTDFQQETAKNNKLFYKKGWFWFAVLIILFPLSLMGSSDEKDIISQQVEESGVPYSNDDDRLALCTIESIKKYGKVDKWFYCGCFCGVHIDDTDKFTSCNNKCLSESL